MATSAVATSGTDKLPSGSWNLGPLTIQWSLQQKDEIDVDVSVFGIDVDTLSGSLNQQEAKLSDTVNVLGIVKGSIALEAKYGSSSDGGLWLEGQLSGPDFDTGWLNTRLIPW